MYRKYMLVLTFMFLISALFLFGPVMAQAECRLENTEISCQTVARQVSSGERVIDYSLLLDDNSVILSEEEREVLLRIVEAEAGGEDVEGRMLVACVVLNRVADDAFPDTVKEVVFQKVGDAAQFSPAYSGRYERVVVSEKTIEAVDRVLAGEDISEGALYFVSRKYADTNKLRWFDEHLTYLFTHGGHEFFH